ncbi:MAG: hypothetical protein Q9182_007161 [Xanthomendoza sp. 2 TL-2023]
MAPSQSANTDANPKVHVKQIDEGTLQHFQQISTKTFSYNYPLDINDESWDAKDQLAKRMFEEWEAIAQLWTDLRFRRLSLKAHFRDSKIPIDSWAAGFFFDMRLLQNKCTDWAAEMSLVYAEVDACDGFVGRKKFAERIPMLEFVGSHE